MPFLFCRAGKEDIIINACCPGLVKAAMCINKGSLTPDQGAETPIMCALLPPGSLSGEFLCPLLPPGSPSWEFW